MALRDVKRHGWRPHLDPRTVRRAHVLGRLAEGTCGHLSTVIAGPGWGKTTALAQFADEQSMPVAWYQIRGADANVTAFALQLVEAIAEEFPGFGAGLIEQLAKIAAPNRNWMALARAIAREADQTLALPFVLVLDDYHLVDEERSIDRLLAALAELLPGHIHLILSARRELPSTLARVSAGGGGCRITEDDLRFTETEGVEYLRLSTRGRSSPAAPDDFVRELEGWPLGLALLAEHLRTNGQVGRLPAALPELFDYLSEEAIRREPADVQELLLTSAIPERFGPELLRRVLGREIATRVDDLARRHLFITRLDERGEWYRFHHLFRAYLQWKLEREKTLQARQHLELLVADAWHALGDEREAVQHELAAADYERAADTLVRLAPAMFPAGQALTLRQWLERLPSEVILHHPQLMVHLGMCHFMDGNAEECRWYLSEALPVSLAQGDRAAHAGAVDLMIRSAMWDDTSLAHLGSVDFYHRHRTSFTCDHPFYALAAAEAGCALGELNRFDEAEEAYGWAEEHPTQHPGIRVPTPGLRGIFVRLPRGDLNSAFAGLQAWYDSARRRDEFNTLPYATLYLALAHFYVGNDDDCRRIAAETIELAEARGMVWFQPPMVAVLGLVALAAGDLQGAREQSAEFERWRERMEGTVWYGHWGDVLQAGLAAADRDIAAYARRVEHTIERIETHGSLFRRAQVLTELARLGLGSPVERPGLALIEDLLAQALESAQAIDARYCLARAHLLLAVVRQEDEQRLHHLRSALLLSRRYGYDGLWLRHERRHAAALLAHAAEPGIEPAYVCRVRHLLEPTLGIAESPALTITTLGRFAVSAGGREIAYARWSHPKLQMLFKYLLSTPNHCAHRDVLIELFWPDLPVAAAHNNLKNTIYHLRHALEPGLRPIQPSHLLHAEGQRYRLSLAANDRWDAEEFLRLAAIAHHSHHNEDFAAAAALYGGEYLPDDVYQDWTEALRERLRVEHVRLILEWGESLAVQGMLEAAVEVTERLLRREPTEEAGHCALMRYYDALGRRDHALRQYRRCQTELRRELEVDPDEETTALYRRILTGETGAADAGYLTLTKS